jgi:hypothetical protein
MGDDYGLDDPMTMGVDSSGQPIHHHYGDGTVGGIGDIHGSSLSDIDARLHAMAPPDGTPLPDPNIPPQLHPSVHLGWLEEKLEDAYYEVTHPDPSKHEPNPTTDEAHHQQQSSHASDDDATNPHTVSTPKQDF